MRIDFTAEIKFNDLLPGPHKPGVVFVFSDNLRWDKIDGATVVGLAGTHSGTHRVLRRAKANDGLLAEDTLVWEYEATFVLTSVNLPSGQLDSGQVTVRGVWFKRNEKLVDAEGQPATVRRCAVTGGTGPYYHARGQGFEPPDGLSKTLEIDL